MSSKKKVKLLRPKPVKPVKPRGPSWLSRAWQGVSPDRRRTILRVVVWTILTAAAAEGIVLGLRALERRILQAPADATVPLTVKLASIPGWMPRELGREIADHLVPQEVGFYDPQATAAVFQRCQLSPWIRAVNKIEKHRYPGRRNGYVEVALDFRRPVARVEDKRGNLHFVDNESCLLPEHQVPRWVITTPARNGQPARQTTYLPGSPVPDEPGLAEIYYVTIRGVTADPPETGRVWKGQDVIEGLKLVALVSTRDYANQITQVDVRNFAGRISRNQPHLRMLAQVGRTAPTEIWFGRFPADSGDYEVPTTRKLEMLDYTAAVNHGKLVGLRGRIDLRYDDLWLDLDRTRVTMH